MIVQIPCPDCKQHHNRDVDIPVNPHALLQGQAFQCPECKVRIELSPESVPVAAKGLEDYARYQAETGRLQQEGNAPLVER